MAIVIRMPSVMAGAKEAALQAWLVDVGDSVDAGQPIAEIETEKAIFEYESEAAGVVAGLLIEPGASAAVGTAIAVLAAVGETTADALAAATALTGSDAGSDPRPTTEPGPEPEPRTAATSGGTAPERLFATPLVRRLARERGIDLGQVQGHGPGGRIVRRDLDAHAATAMGAAEPVGGDPVPATAASWSDTPHTPMRRAIARRLTESTSTIPHFTVVADCRADALLKLRSSINADRERPVTVNDLVVKAVGAALMAVPEANAIWTPDAIRRFAHADVGVAIAVDGGLVTPVIRSVDEVPLGRLSEALRNLTERARAGRLRQQELEGGAFSVSNLGMYGTKEFSAIINPPQSAILAVGAATPRVAVVDGQPAVATVMTVTLSADHRVLDGALAARWLQAFTRIIENPVSMLV